MRRTPCIAALLLALSACGEPEAGTPAALGELCGVEGPVRLLELAHDYAMIGRPYRIGERLFYRVGPLGTSTAEYPEVPVSDVQLWTTGLCGEAPTRLDEQFSKVFEIERWPGLALACDHAGSIVSLAPTGPLAPHLLFSAGDCDAQWSAHGMLTRYSKTPPFLVLHRYPADPRSGTSFANEVLLQALALQGGQPAFAVRGDVVFALSYGHDLMVIDLRTGALTLRQPGVDMFTVSPSGRYFMWHVWLPKVGPSGWPSGITMLHDRETGYGHYLGETSSGRAPSLEWADRGFVHVVHDNGEHRVYGLPGLEYVTVPEHYSLNVGLLADGLWILWSFPDGSLHYFDASTGQRTPMHIGPARVLTREPGGTQVLGLMPCCSDKPWASVRDEGPLWFFPDDGEPQLLAARSTLFAWRPRADLLATVLDVRGDRRGTLMLVDTATQEEFVVDEHVFATHLKDPAEPDILRYTVQDGARSGVWQVRLPP